MKKLFLFALPLMLLVACKGVEQYRAGIEELSGSWDTTTKAITDFAAMVSGDMSNYTQAAASMPMMDEAAAKKMKPEQVAAMDAAKKGVTDALGAYAPLQQTINDFVKTWSEKSAEVTALKDGLAAGKIEGDVNAKLTELNALVATGNENLKAWEASYATVKAGVESALANLKQTIAANSGAGYNEEVILYT
jgi:hypothetical protein